MSEKVETWAVEVSLNGERALSIGHDWLSGREDIADFKDEVVRCAEHLLSFVGGETEQVATLRAKLTKVEEALAEMTERARKLGEAVLDPYHKPIVRKQYGFISQDVICTCPACTIAREVVK